MKKIICFLFIISCVLFSGIAEPIFFGIPIIKEKEERVKYDVFFSDLSKLKFSEDKIGYFGEYDFKYDIDGENVKIAEIRNIHLEYEDDKLFLIRIMIYPSEGYDNQTILKYLYIKNNLRFSDFYISEQNSEILEFITPDKELLQTWYLDHKDLVIDLYFPY